MPRWRFRTKAIFAYFGSLAMILVFLLVFTINSDILKDSKAEIIKRRNLLIGKTAIDRIDGIDRNNEIRQPVKIPGISTDRSDEKKKNPKIIITENIYKVDITKYKKEGIWQIPPFSILPNISWPDLSTIYHEYLNGIQYDCKERVRVGKITDGGWEICEDEPYKPSRNSLIYSFGIANDFSFDDAVSKKYKAKVHSFDPSIKLTDHVRSDFVTFHALGLADYTGVSDKGWKMSTLTDIKKDLGHEQKNISVLKMDVEEWEWKILPHLIKTKSLDNIQHLLLEVHICEGCSIYKPQQLDKEASKQQYILALHIFKNLHDLGFRIFWRHKNLACLYKSRFTNTERSACHEIYMVKIR